MMYPVHQNKKTTNDIDALKFAMRLIERSSMTDVRNDVEDYERIERNISHSAYVVDNCERLPAIISNTYD